MPSNNIGIFWGIAAIVLSVLSVSCLLLTGDSSRSMSFCAAGIASCALMRTYK